MVYISADGTVGGKPSLYTQVMHFFSGEFGEDDDDFSLSLSLRRGYTIVQTSQGPVVLAL
jgi:hypothetical protein